MYLFNLKTVNSTYIDKRQTKWEPEWDSVKCLSRKRFTEAILCS